MIHDCVVVMMTIMMMDVPVGSASKSPLVDMVKDDGACACRQDATGKVRLVSWLKKVKRLVLVGHRQFINFHQSSLDILHHVLKLFQIYTRLSRSA